MDKKVIVISGATSGIGRATADYFNEKGYDVWCLARKEPENYPYNFVTCDVASVESINNAVSVVLQNVKSVDVLLCNAGIGLGGAMESYNTQDVKNMFDVNFFGAYDLAKAFLPKLKEQQSGKIIFVSSVGSIFALPFQGMYSATKSALEAMAYAWRAELAPFKVQVGCVLPGDTKTGFTKARKNTFGDEYAGRDKKSVDGMAKDEQNGHSPRKVAKVIFKQANKRKMSPRKIVGVKYKMFAFLNRIVPTRLVQWVVKKMYAD